MAKEATFKIGVIADIQYADIDDGYNYNGTQHRKYREALENAKASIKVFNQKKVDCVLQLGDILDGQNAAGFGPLKGKPPVSEKALSEVLEVFDHLEPKVPVYHAVGNHELYNFSWEQLSAKLNDEHKLHKISENSEKFYFAFTIKDWKFINLNPYYVTLMQDKTNEGFKEAKEVLKKNPNFEFFYPEFDPDIETPASQCDYFKGLNEFETYLCPFNGGLGKKQMKWLEEELKQGKNLKQKMVILSHIPLHRGATNQNGKTLIFEHEEVMGLLEEYKEDVHLVLGGHKHDGDYHYDDKLKIHFVVLQSPLVHGVCHAVLKFHDNKIVMEGTEAVPSKVLSLNNA